MKKQAFFSPHRHYPARGFFHHYSPTNAVSTEAVILYELAGGGFAFWQQFISCLAELTA